MVILSGRDGSYRHAQEVICCIQMRVINGPCVVEEKSMY